MIIAQHKWQKNITLFLTAQTISLFGSSLVQFAIIWYITLTTSSGVMIMLSTLCGFLPQIIMSLFAGVWIDRYNRKNIIMLADGLIALATLLLALLFLAGYKAVWLVFIVLLIRSLGTGIQVPAVNAIIPQIVPKQHLMRINSINGTINAMMVFLSLAASGAIYALVSIEKIFFIDVVTALIGITFVYCIPIAKYRSELSGVSHIAGIKQGISYFRQNAFIKRLVIFLMLVLLLCSPSAFLTPLMVSRSFGPESWRLMANEMTFSIGMTLGGLLLSIWGGFSDKYRTLSLSCVLYSGSVLLLSVMPNFPLYLLCNFFVGISLPYFNTPLTVILQERVDPAMYGRVFGLVMALNSSMLPLGMLFFGPLADWVQIESIFMVTGILGLLYGSYLYRSKTFRQ